MIDFSKKPLVLAPLDGWTDLCFRNLCAKLGADVTISEMISANALVYNTKDSLKTISPTKTGYFGVQISANSAQIAKQATEILNAQSHIDFIDLNIGCPAKNVVAHGSGSALLKDLRLLESILLSIKKTNKSHTSAKIRLGWDFDNSQEILKVCEACGLDFLSVHGRTKKQGFKGSSDFKAIAKLKQIAKIPIIANGDIGLENATSIQAQTNADALMIGRAALGMPDIFNQIKKIKTTNSKKQIVLEHFSCMIKTYGDYGAIIFRKHLHKYAKNTENAASFRQEFNTQNNPKILTQMLENFNFC